MSEFLDLTGQRFGKLVVINRIIDERKKPKWLCKCDCGILCTCITSYLTSGFMMDCGCVKRKEIEFKQFQNNFSRLKSTWRNMIYRCYNVSNISYKNYGGRGITVCEEWLHDFESFKDWSLSHGYSDELSIDRIDVNGNYEPSNCRWITQKEQCNNTRRNHYYTYNGKTQTLKQWADEYNMTYSTLKSRMRTYKDIAFVLSTRWCD